jgi:histone deacetylase complex subunit SAP30
MPPKRNHDDAAHSSLKDKLQNLQGSNARGGRRNGPNAMNGSSLKEVDNASTNSGQTSTDLSSSGNVSRDPRLRYRILCHAVANTYSLQQIKWSSQESSVLRDYRRAHRLDCPSSFKNPLSHVVLSQGIGRMSPTMARSKAKRRVQKETLAMAVKKSFNAGAVSESDVIVDWLYKSKNQGRPPQANLSYTALLTFTSDKEFRVRFAPQRK